MAAENSGTSNRSEQILQELLRHVMKTTKTLSFALLLLFLLLNGPPLNAQSNKYVVKIVARPLPLSAVRITGGPLKRAQDLNGEYLLKLEPDRMLAYYRKRAGRAKTRRFACCA